MTISEIKDLINNFLPSEEIKISQPESLQPQLIIPPGSLSDVLSFLQRNSNTYFDQLACITAIDNDIKIGTIEIIYQLYSIPYNHSLAVKIFLNRDVNNYHDQVSTVSHIYRTAVWHEREIFDFFGIRFTNHPDMRRLFLPLDWEGYPLRKDYKQQDYYRGIKVEF